MLRHTISIHLFSTPSMQRKQSSFEKITASVKKQNPTFYFRLPFFSSLPTAQQSVLPAGLHQNKKTKNAKGALKNGRLYPRASRAEGEMPSPCFSQAEGISFPSFPQCHLASKCSQALFHERAFIHFGTRAVRGPSPSFSARTRGGPRPAKAKTVLKCNTVPWAVG